MTNIYQKQMNKLKLNAKQYAELTGMPYEVVKDILYNKEGDYSMEIKNLLRKNMMNKHQEIENNYGNAKIKAMELKQNNSNELLNWYNNVYTLKLLKQKLNLKSLNTFKESYNITFNGEKCSPWTYQLLLGKREYEGHYIATDKKMEFIRQLYDILVNDNSNFYLNKKSLNKVADAHKQKTSILKWFKKFDFDNYIKENDISKTILAEKCDINYTTLCHLIKKRKHLIYETEQMKKIYNYINNKNDDNTNQNEKLILSNDITNEQLEVLKEQPQVITSAVQEIEFTSANNDIMRKILVSRLTDEEKALIELFGGKIC